MTLDLGLGRFSHDLGIDSFDLVLVERADNVAQHIKTRLLFVRGEWFLNGELGVPWFEDILVKNPRGVLVEAALKAAIRETPGVNSLDAFVLDYIPGTRQLGVSFRATTDFGTVDIDRLRLNV